MRKTMRQKKITFIIFLILTNLLSSQIIINEVMFDTEGAEYHDEFVEIYNNSENIVDLSGWMLSDDAETDILIKYHGYDNMLLHPHQYCVIMDSSYYLNSTYYETLIPDSALRIMINDGSFGQYGLNNSTPETVSIFDPDSLIVASYEYTINQTPGYSDERISFTDNNWGNSKTLDGTPGFKNSLFPFNFDIEIIQSTPPPTLHLTENIFTIKLQNSGLERIDQFLLSAYIDDIFYRDTLQISPLNSTDSVEVEFKIDFENSGTRIIRFQVEINLDENLLNNIYENEIFIPYPDNVLVLNEFMKNPDATQCEYIEIFNLSENPIDLVDFGLSDELIDRVVYFPDVQIQSHDYFVIADNEFINDFYGIDISKVFIALNMATLNNTTDKIYLLTKDKTALDSISYVNFNEDNGRSIEKISPELNSFDLDNWKYCTLLGTPTQKNSVSPQDHDLELTLVNIPENIQVNTDFKIDLKVKNVGINDIASFQCNAYDDNILLRDYDHQLSILSSDSVEFSLVFNISKSGTDSIIFDLETNLDDNLLNNEVIAKIYIPYNERSIVLNEFMKYPDDSQCEWIEIVNISEDSLNLGDFSITDSNKDVLIPFPDILLSPNDFFVLAENNRIYDFYAVVPEKVYINGSLPGLNNDLDCIYILDKLNFTVDSILYSDFNDDNGISVEKINPEFNSSILSNWVLSVSTATPTKENSVFQDPYDNNNENNFSLYPKTVTPNDDGNNDNLIISYDFDSAYIYLTVKIYNIKGQQVAIPANSLYTSSKNDFVWNCKDSKGMTVKTGAYICFLNVKNSDGKIIKLKEVFYITK
ncbi:MAG: hypothetical protein GQ534_06825 [Candidatus Delongbacteria bacterium]|nr:hypothetical protein [Candidatus Delongbacteria bacterium]